MTDDRKTRLRGLGPDVLADALLDLANQYDEADKLVERLLAPIDTAGSRIKGELDALQREKRNYDWNSARTLAIKIHMLLGDIASSIHDAQVGVGLMLSFYKTDIFVFERCDDSSGYVGDVYRNEAPELFARYAKDFSNRADLLAQIKALIAADDYGVRDSILDHANEWLTPQEMRSLAAESAACAQLETDSYRRVRWFRMAESMARLLKDGALFEQLQRAASDELGSEAKVNIAEAYLAGGDYARALEFLEPVAADGIFLQARRDELRMKAYQQTGRDADAQALAWTIFHRSRGMAALERLLKIIGASRRDEVVAQEIERIETSQVFSTDDAELMIETGHVSQCARYVERHSAQIDGRSYYWLPTLANTLQSHGHLLAATLVFRALLVSLLERGYIKAYRYGAGYLHQLQVMAPGIVDWGDSLDHAEFHQYLQSQHGRKRSFWAQVREA
ncbi:hypothetical protein H0A66_13535 [Alcaligenaceae bacterium]|nr:hypothetical protein [Alcaligenaceae bacterium]